MKEERPQLVGRDKLQRLAVDRVKRAWCELLVKGHGQDLTGAGCGRADEGRVAASCSRYRETQAGQ